jgi:hypothetical protein
MSIHEDARPSPQLTSPRKLRPSLRRRLPLFGLSVLLLAMSTVALFYSPLVGAAGVLLFGFGAFIAALRLFHARPTPPSSTGRASGPSTHSAVEYTGLRGLMSSILPWFTATGSVGREQSSFLRGAARPDGRAMGNCPGSVPAATSPAKRSTVPSLTHI